MYAEALMAVQWTTG